MLAALAPALIAASVAECEKRPASGSRGMAVTDHPLASGAGAQALLAGGNVVDAAVTALFALTMLPSARAAPR